MSFFRGIVGLYYLYFFYYLLLLIKSYTYSIIVATNIKQALVLSMKAYQQCHIRVVVKHSGKKWSIIIVYMVYLLR